MEEINKPQIIGNSECILRIAEIGVEHELEISEIDKLILEYLQKLSLTPKQAFLNLIIEVKEKVIL